MTLLMVHRLSVLGSLVVGTNHCVLETPHRSCCFGDALTQSSSHHNFALKSFRSLLLLIFLLPKHQLQKCTAPLLPNISHPLIGAISLRYSMLFTSLNDHMPLTKRELATVLLNDNLYSITMCITILYLICTALIGNAWAIIDRRLQ